jgi:hypothetical protein
MSGQLAKSWPLAALSGAISLLFLVIYPIIDSKTYGPATEEAKSWIEGELLRIGAPAGSVPGDRSVITKPGEAFYQLKYSCSLPYLEIRHYYDEELSRAGWLFWREEVVRDWGTPVGTEVKYRKGDYEASLFYTTDPKRFGMDVSISISWQFHQPSNHDDESRSAEQTQWLGNADVNNHSRCI